MELHLDNNYILVLLIVLVSFTYLYLTFNKNDTFETNQNPAPATIIKKDPIILSPRVVSPSGPNPPNAHVSEKEARKQDVLNVVPTDPYDETYGSQNMKDNLRYPERSFGPGILNDGKKVLVANGVASAVINPSENAIQQFSQEMVQNGGLFNSSYGANDTNLNPNYAAF